MAEHRAMIGFELEVLAVKLDRFGWERMRGTPVMARLLGDWMDALQDFPIEEVRAACRACIADRPQHMPNEGAVLAQIMEARRKRVAALPRNPEPVVQRAPVEDRRRSAAEIMAKVGYRVRPSQGAAN
ncbi:hypothetical protein [Ketogulonicigenium vulgare]|uniref:hypothetical protein n=1 Tax=Ketogulonicigenium vulgare TaxID=92945 RepID=UPI0023595CE5|nr:hypothetical protein [Ketogulonicigenium vulgare]